MGRRANLEAMLDAAAVAGVGAVLCTVVGNDFEPPLVPSHSARLSDEDRTRFQRLEGMSPDHSSPGASGR